MSDDVVISVERLSKRYRLGQIGGTTLREDVSRLWARLRGQPDPTLKVDQVPARQARHPGEPAQDTPPSSGSVRVPGRRLSPSSSEYVWALKDVSFEVRRGEVLGIIGRNGAGKSTLLKILSRITAPTTGRVCVKGRIASLLEIGTGMHPELTGRENIYLNGAILGMTKSEITRKLDEIVAFSGVERFIDTPVKRYSSGMMVRLGFAVAAHLEPEILIVDEVLAVGDAEFQKKCLGKMQDVAGHGRTVLFVSHNMGAVGALCRSVMCLDAGKVSVIGQASGVIREYLDGALGKCTHDLIRDSRENACAAARFVRCSIWQDGQPRASLDVTKGFEIVIDTEVRSRLEGAEISVSFLDSTGHRFLTTNLSDSVCVPVIGVGICQYRVHVPGSFLAPDTYSLLLCIHRPNAEIIDLLENRVSFRVEESGSAMYRYSGARFGNIMTVLPWDARSATVLREL